MSRKLLVLFACLCCAISCRQRTPVDEVSLSESGVKLAEVHSTLQSSDWPGWRGPTGDGIVVDQALPTTWSDKNGVQWRAMIPGRGHSSPILVGEQIVMATAIDRQQEQLVLALNREDGSERWHTVLHQGGFPAPGEVHQKATNANSTVVSDGERLFIAMLNQNKIFVTALDLQGKILWQKEAGAFASKFGYAPSPVLYKSLVIVAADNFGGGYLAAFDQSTGDLAWRTARGDASTYSSPTVANVGGRDQLLLSGGDRVASYDPASGQLNWETPCIAEATCGTIVVAHDRILASGGYPDKQTVCLSSEGEKIWSNRTKLYEPSLIAYEGNVFAVTDNGVAYCWSIEDGQQQWQERLGGNFSSSPIICNGNLYVANLSGDCFVISASADGGKPIAKNKIGDDCYASPAVGNGRIYFRVGVGQGPQRREELVCIGNTE